MRSFEYRLYPTKAQAIKLDACLEASRLLYNEMLELEQTEYASTGKFLFKYDLSLRFKGRGGEFVPQTTVQCLASRLDKALKAMLVRKKKVVRGGFPRFKGFLRWHSFQLRKWGSPGDVWVEDGCLRVPKKLGINIKLKLHRQLEGTPKTCHIVKRVDKWYAVIVCDVELNPPINTEPPIGIDVGLKSFLTDSNGETMENPHNFCSAERKLRKQQRRSSRRVKGSKRRRKANVQVAKTHLKVKRQRRDFHFKVAKKYAESSSMICVEDLNIAGMIQNHHIAKSIADAGWAQFLDILSSKVEETGGQVVRVPAYYTSQKCSSCGEIVPKSLSVRTHVCSHCGYVADRDVNAALNILQAGLQKIPLGQSGQTLTYEVTQCVV